MPDRSQGDPIFVARRNFGSLLREPTELEPQVLPEPFDFQMVRGWILRERVDRSGTPSPVSTIGRDCAPA
jgi:hypothetical protein